ncbi:MAG: phosphatase PAP2 family protein [Eubacteriales bacterium]|nr:phosphatase PAP2 family protein [Eubacteriales bacterium]
MNKHYSYVLFYNSIEKWFNSHTRALKLLLFLYNYMSWAIAAAYAFLIAYCISCKDIFSTVKVITVPLTAFIVVTVLRYCIDCKRPYTKYPLNPLVIKEKTGESMPSRHMLSITIIAMVWLYIYMPVGIVLWILSVIMGIVRVLAGVHFPRDIIVAALISVIFGYTGLWLL